jgi:hypothetical protein
MSVNDVNSWMNQPGGLTESGGRITSVNVWQVYELPHMILAASMVSGFTAAGVYGWIPPGRRDHHTGLKIPGLDSLLVGFGPGTRVTEWDGIPDAYRLGICTEAYAGETA